MTRTKKQTHNGDERAALILELFRQLPDNKFSLRHLASASGGASKEGRRETMQIVEPTKKLCKVGLSIGLSNL